MISTKSRVAPPDAATSCRARTLSRRWKGCAKAEIRRGSRRAARATDGSGWPAERPTAHHRIRRAALRGRRRRSSAEPHSSLGRPQPGQNRNALVSVLPQRRQGRRFTDSLYAPPAHVPPSAPQRVTTRRGAALGRGGPFLSTPCRTRRDRGLSAEAPAACSGYLQPGGLERPSVRSPPTRSPWQDSARCRLSTTRRHRGRDLLCAVSWRGSWEWPGLCRA